MSPSKVQKRKRNSSNLNPKKRRKGRESSEPGRGEGQEKQISDTREYLARQILKEDKKKGYYIEWEDDPTTGESFEPTWEPKACANEALIADWEKKKAERKTVGKSTPKPRKNRNQTTRIHVKRVNRVVESSPISQNTSSCAPILRELQNNGEQTGYATELHLEQSSPKANGLPSPPPALTIHPQAPIVQVTQASDFDPEDYERFSSQQQTQTQIGSSPGKIPETPSTSSSTSPQSQAFKFTKKFISDGVIPDSQSLPGSSSYIPSAQTVSGLNLNQTQNLGSNSITEAQSFASTVEEVSASSSPAPVPETDPIEDSSSPVITQRDNYSDPIETESPTKPPGSISSPAQDTPGNFQTSSTTNVSHQHRGENLKSSQNEGQASKQRGQVDRRDFASVSRVEAVESREPGTQTQHSLPQSPVSITEYPQEGQVVPGVDFLPGSQDDSAGVIRPTTEVSSTHSNTTLSQTSPSDDEIEPLLRVRRLHSTPGLPTQLDQDGPGRLRNYKPSSSLPPIPSQSLNTFGTTIPPPLQTVSDLSASPIMNPSSEPAMSMTEHYKLAKAERRRKLQEQSPTGSGTRSPSVIPDQASPQAPQTSLRASNLSNLAQEMSPPPRPPTTSVTTGIATTGEVKPATTNLLDEPRLDQGEYIVPLSMDGLQGDQYRKILWEDRDLIKEFVSKPYSADSPIVGNVRILLERIQDIEGHMDLLNAGTLTQAGVRPEDQAMWDVNCSVKFRFLGALLDCLRERNIHIVLLGRPTRLLDIVETFLKGKHINYEYPSELRKADPSQVDSALSVTLLATSGEDTGAVIRGADLIICLDGTSTRSQIQGLRGTHLIDATFLAPVISPVIIKSAEHINRCIPLSVNSTERFRILVNSMTHLRTDAGKLPADYPRAHAVAEEVARLLEPSGGANNARAKWALPPIGGIKDAVAFEESQSQFLITSTMPANTQEPVGAQKRGLDIDRLDPAKKMRMTPQPPETVNPADVSLTRISDSVGRSSHAQAPDNTSSSPTDDAQDVSALLARIKAADADISSLQARLEASQARLNEYMASLESLQYRFEKSGAEIRAARKERDEAVIRAAVALKEKDSLAARLEKADEARRAAQTQLDAERAANASSTDTNIAELSRLRAALAETETAKDKAEKSIARKEADFEFLRSEYQKASSAAAEYADRIESLEAQNTNLTRKADGQAVKLKRMGIDENQRSLLREIQKLKLELENREKLLAQREEELKSVKNLKGLGMGTRAASVPRSPRVGANGGSRAASPLPGGRINLLRNQ
ncbi:hypothetical protein AOQ84DRAFT_388142 [Glonium stellatum]|uniref:Chromo domain-containing protein n=1 Tax=Glonium stellatum TaxID=574774 RepID=A0A8E2F3W7_9PEZI|nr:hypothetical protein AOQ84DRAFT_388142 [Glonium stellatum]